MFVHEYPIIDSALSIEQLRLRLKDNELEQYGDAFTPEFVYEVIRRLPRFSTMRVIIITIVFCTGLFTDISLARTSARCRRVPWLSSGGNARRMCQDNEVFRFRNRIYGNSRRR